MPFVKTDILTESNKEEIEYYILKSIYEENTFLYEQSSEKFDVKIISIKQDKIKYE